jgi:FAD/FMN-containing dehydrogenase
MALASNVAGWHNWSGGVRCNPRSIETATSEAAIAQQVRRGAQEGKSIRVTGAGHSFSALCQTDSILLNLAGPGGIAEVDSATHEASIWAGSRIADLGDALYAAGFGMENQGDIDSQSLAGAISTATHGTGIRFGNLSTQVAGLRLVLASGEILSLSRSVEGDLFRAAAVSFGLFGVISQIRLRAVPAYRLHERTWAASFEECRADVDRLIKENEHFEFFWLPKHDACAMKCLNSTAAPVSAPVIISEAPPGTLERYLHPERVDWSHRIYPSVRTTLFNEMEFALPFERGWECLEEIRRLIREKHTQIIWGVEYRTVAADDLSLSPAFGRKTIAISIHEAADVPYERFFTDAQAVFLNHGGRPHWGKIHYCTAAQLRAFYPQWDSFWSLRRRIDPRGVFLNDYMRNLGGVPT